MASILDFINPLDSKGNYSATSNNTKLVHWPLMGGLLHLVQRGRNSASCGPAQSSARYTKCNNPPINGQCTYHCMVYDGPLLCGVNVAIKELILFHRRSMFKMSALEQSAEKVTF